MYGFLYNNNSTLPSSHLYINSWVLTFLGIYRVWAWGRSWEAEAKGWKIAPLLCTSVCSSDSGTTLYLTNVAGLESSFTSKGIIYLRRLRTVSHGTMGALRGKNREHALFSP